MSYIDTPSYLHELHGVEPVRPMEDPLPFSGGIFGQPPLPLNRSGIFVERVSLPRRKWQDDPLRGPLENEAEKGWLVVNAVPPSRGPVAGLAGVGESGRASWPVVLGMVGLVGVAYWLAKGQ